MKRFHLPMQCLMTWVACCPLVCAEDTPVVPAPSSGSAAEKVVVPSVAGDFVPPIPRQPLPALPQSKILHRSSIAQQGRTVTIEKIVPPDDSLIVRPAIVEPTAAQVATPEEIAAGNAARLREIRAHPMVVMGVFATVYDHSATLLSWRHGDEEYQAWSNFDFNLLQDVFSLEADTTTYLYFMMIGKGSNEQVGTESGTPITPQVPMIPALPEEPGFVVVKGDPDNVEAVRGIRALHDLYAADHDQLVAAYQQRLRYQEAAEAWQKEHPPHPENVTIRWWHGKRTPKSGAGGIPATKTEGAEP